MPKKTKIEGKNKFSSEVVKKKKESEKLSIKDYEKKIIDLAKKGLTAEKIGEKLRQQGIHSKEYGKKISKTLKEKNIYVNPDIKNVEEKLKKVGEHSSKNKQDKRSKREKDRIYSQLRKLKKYFKIPVK